MNVKRIVYSILNINQIAGIMHEYRTITVCEVCTFVPTCKLFLLIYDYLQINQLFDYTKVYYYNITKCTHILNKIT